VALQDRAQYIGMIDKADAVRDADLPVTHALGELHDFLDPRPLAVALGFDQRGHARDLARLRIVVQGARKLLRLMDALEENEDVQDVYANFDIPEGILEAVAG